MFEAPEPLDGPVGDVSLRKLEIFCTVAALGSVRRAAEVLYVTQPAVSAQLKYLQERVGARLLYWDGSEMHLTEAGHRIHAWARDVLARTRDVMSEVRGFTAGSRGRVRVSTSLPAGPYLVGPILADFASAHRDVEICLTSYFPEHVTAVAAGGGCDFAVTIEEESVVSEPGLEYEVLGYEEIVLIGRPGGLPRRASIAQDELSELSFVLPPQQFVGHTTFLRKQLTSPAIYPLTIAAEIDQAETIKEAVKRDVGVAFLSRRAVQDDLDDGTLRSIKVKDLVLRLPVLLLRGRGRWFSPAQQHVLESLRTGIVEALGR
jgi:DNA-binding transcriptional LysR family regulator